MVKAADARISEDLGSIGEPRFHGSADRCIADRGMDSLRVVIVDVLTE
jgi:hypothetical protein